MCKSAAKTNGHPGSTRLCEACRLMIEPILPRQTAAFVAQPQYAVSAASRWEVARPVEFEAKTEAEEEDYELVSFEPAAESKKDFLEEAEEIFGRTAAPDSTAARETFTSPARPEVFDKNALSQPGVEMPMAFKSIGSTRNQAHAIEDRISQAEPPAPGLRYVEQTDQSIARLNGAHAEPVNEAKATTEESPVDPWDDPLPAWEYSRNEWPIVVEAQRQSTFAKLKAPIAVGVLAVLAILIYFAFWPSAEKPQDQISVATPELDGQAKPEASTTADAQTPTAAPASDAAATTPAQPIPSQSAASDEGNAQWKYSLQAMASQNEEEAKQFAEKLVRSGVAAYVVSADLGQRGKWHRVRVGRFLTAEEATRFINEARERARAAGVGLKELNLCAYEKP